MSLDSPPVYLLPGMAYDYPVFSRLAPLLKNVKLVNYTEPKTNESLSSYAERMAAQFQPDSFIGGVSFGGMLALEISRIVQPKGCFIISSVKSPRQLPPRLRNWRIIGSRNCARALGMVAIATRMIPKSARTNATMRARMKLNGNQGKWYRWATSAVVGWQEPDMTGCPMFHIHGDADETFPIKYVRPDVVINSGGHALPVSHSQEVADAINHFMSGVA